MSRLSKLADLENDICDLAEMAELASSYVADAIHSMLKYKDQANGLLPLGPQEERLILFCIYQLEKRTGDLKEAFYEKLAEDRP